MKKKIIIIEDHIQTAVAISDVLDSEGFDTMQVYKGEEGIELCNKEKPDLVLIEHRLDHLDGYDVAAKIPQFKKFVMSTDELDEKKSSKLKNFLGIIQKPIDDEDLLKNIREALSIPEPESEY